MNADEKRSSGRVRLVGRCWCDSPALSQYVHIDDASEGGFFIKTLSPFVEGEQVRVKWGFPNEPLSHEACMQVVWRRRNGSYATDPGMGLKFLDISQESAEALKKFITRSRKIQ